MNKILKRASLLLNNHLTSREGAIYINYMVKRFPFFLENYIERYC